MLSDLGKKALSVEREKALSVEREQTFDFKGVQLNSPPWVQWISAVEYLQCNTTPLSLRQTNSAFNEVDELLV